MTIALFHIPVEYVLFTGLDVSNVNIHLCLHIETASHFKTHLGPPKTRIVCVSVSKAISLETFYYYHHFHFTYLCIYSAYKCVLLYKL